MLGRTSTGGRYVRFDGDDWLAFPRLSIQTAIFVVRHRTGTSAEYETLLGDTSSAEWLGSYGTTLFAGIASSIPKISEGSATLNGRPIKVTHIPKPAEFEVVTLALTSPVGVSTIANDRGVAGRYWNGDFLEIRLFDRKLNAAEVSRVAAELSQVFSIRAPAQIVTDGNSLTAGSAARTGTDYPSQLIGALTPAFGAYDTFNVAVGGQTTPFLTATATERVDSLLDKSRPESVLVFWEGSNHLTDPSAGVVTAESAFAKIEEYCQARRAAGWKVVVLTVLPRSDGYAKNNFEGRREILNSMIRQHWRRFADALADVASLPEVGLRGSEFNSTYFQKDRVHLTPQGDGVVARLVRDAVMALKR